jgi:dienelactone hydrolase
MKKIGTIRPFTLFFSLHVVLASLCSLLIGLTALSGVATAQNPVPLINQPLVPDAAVPGGKGFTLTVNGTGFVSGSTVNWNGSALATTFVSGSQVTATVPASNIGKRGTASVTVSSPGPGGGTSNIVFLPITLPVELSFGGAALGAGSAPTSAVVDDFNGDGKLDLAVANNSGNNISVFLGKGDGTFQAPVNYGTGANPVSGMIAGDLRGNGKLDLVVPNNGGDTVSVLLGNGDGTFQAAVNYSTGPSPTWVAVGDFNRDGKLDLVVADQNCTYNPTKCGVGTFSILLGNGDGTFQAHVDHHTPQGAEGLNSVAVGDFNNDGILDLAVAAGIGGGGTQISLLLGKDDGTFRSGVNYTAGLNPAAITTADFNHDGKLDLAVVNNIGSVSILLGNGDGTFQTHVDYGTASFPFGTVGTADFNEDGNLDFAVANSGSNTVSVFLGNSDGTFQPQFQINTGSGPRGAVVGDFNRDGRPDLAVPNFSDNTVSILLQNGTVALLPPSLNFGVQLIRTKSAEQKVTLTNVGTTTLNIGSIALTGRDFSEHNNCPSSLPPKGHCTINVAFMPTALGPRAATLTITDDGTGSPQSVPLSGIGVTSGPNATLSTHSLTFATQLVDTASPAQPVTLNNWGTETLDIGSISASGDFSGKNDCGSSLPPGGNCTVSVTFTPTQRGHRTGTVTFTDNAPNSPQIVHLSGVGTVVKLDPSSLNFGTVPIGQKSSPQNTTLTNVGKAKLHITIIQIKGTDAGEFSQQNDCPDPGYLGAGRSCTITVTFTPHVHGNLSADVSVSDDGGASPQQVSLSGFGCTFNRFHHCKEADNSLSGASAQSALAASLAPAAPSSTGPSSVGTRVVDLVDSTRNDPFLANGAKRELLVRFWYPASLDRGCAPAQYTSPRVWSYFSELVGIPLPEVRTNSCLNAPITGGTHPVVVFTHGYTGTFTDYTFIFEDLASRGYVVASVDHTYEATAVEFPDGRFIKSLVGSHFGDTWRLDDQTLASAVSVRLADLHFVVDELRRMNAKVGGPFAGKLDSSRIALMGHSLGGEATISGMQQETRFRAGVLLDGVLSDESVPGTDKAILILAAGRDQWSKDECRLWSNLRGPRFAVNLKGAEHITPTDAVWLARGAIRTSAMGPDKTIAAIRDYIAAFLDTNLRGKPFDPLLTGPSADYPDAAVTTQKQLLCAEGIDH